MRREARCSPNQPPDLLVYTKFPSKTLGWLPNSNCPFFILIYISKRVYIAQIIIRSSRLLRIRYVLIPNTAIGVRFRLLGLDSG